MHGLYLLWWVQEKHVPAPTLAVLLAAGDLALMALEVPTGWFADKFGHRKSLIAGSAVQVVGMLLCWLGEGVPGVLAASLLVALGDALRSGADQALLYRTCLALDRETDFQRIQGQTYAWQAVALLVQVLAGGFIVQRWGFAAGWIVETILCAIGLGIACAMVEPPSASDARSEPVSQTADGGDARPRWDPRVFSFSFVALMLPAAFVASGHTATAFLVQTLGGSSAVQMTWLVAAIALAEAIGSAVATRARDAGLRIQVAIGLFGVLTLVTGLTVRPLLVPGAIVLSLLDGVALPLHRSRFSGSPTMPCAREQHHSPAPVTWRSRRSRCRSQAAGVDGADSLDSRLRMRMRCRVFGKHKKQMRAVYDVHLLLSRGV